VALRLQTERPGYIETLTICRTLISRERCVFDAKAHNVTESLYLPNQEREVEVWIAVCFDWSAGDFGSFFWTIERQLSAPEYLLERLWT
jgi:chemotaxis methyl-accepting protein methylase